MYFEGPEKKLEIALTEGAPLFREKGQEYWSTIVAKANASILSKISNASCDAYLLSESSLFVFDDRLVMITCGRTTLIRAAESILRDISSADVEMLFYERKNEKFPQHQPSDFYEDIESLNRYFPGNAYRFGSEDEAHIYLYHLNRRVEAKRRDTTLEVLMEGIAPDVAKIFSMSTTQSAAEVRSQTQIDQIIPGFTVDDYLFAPRGYSLNAIRDQHYFTFHVTPEQEGSYVSFETNFAPQDELNSIVDRVLNLFRPKNWDVFLLQDSQRTNRVRLEYPLVTRDKQNLACGFRVDYHHYRSQKNGTKTFA